MTWCRRWGRLIFVHNIRSLNCTFPLSSPALLPLHSVTADARKTEERGQCGEGPVFSFVPVTMRNVIIPWHTHTVISSSHTTHCLIFSSCLASSSTTCVTPWTIVSYPPPRYLVRHQTVDQHCVLLLSSPAQSWNKMRASWFKGSTYELSRG